MEKFTGYQKGMKDGVVTYKCFFKVEDSHGFTTTVVKYLGKAEFDKLPQLKKGE